MSWRDPPIFVKYVSKHIVRTDTTLSYVIETCRAFRDYHVPQQYADDQWSALKSDTNEDIAPLIAGLVLDTRSESTPSAVIRYVVSYQSTGNFPWTKPSTDEYDVDEIVDTNVSDNDIRSCMSQTDVSGMEQMKTLPDTVVDSHIPDNLPPDVESDVRSIVSSKCANIIKTDTAE